MDKPTVQDGQVVSMEYTLHVDGQLIDSSQGRAPLEFLQGAGNIIPGLEDELYGMEVGETKNVIVSAEDGYGELDPDAFVDVPRAQFPTEIPLEIGVELQVRDDSGRVLLARIDRVDDESVRLDFNHPLAGKELDFTVKIVGLRDATDEEMEHGHVHGHDHAH
ncbi:MAG: peptidylprolyl isomerase [Anaerolineae bacterium]|nr:MAG: peptidylprolyl isomerase [Anaerolineae bacterium]